MKVIRYKSKQWNQTNYYSLDRDRLAEFINLEMAVNFEISEMCNTPAQDENNQTLKVRSGDISLYEPKITTKERTTKTSDPASFQDARERASLQRGDLLTNKSDSIAAATPKTALEEERSQKNNNPHSAGITASPGQKKQESGQKKSNLNEETNVAKVDYIVNKKWEKLIPLLDSVGIPINKTIEDLLKLHPKEKVEGAITLRVPFGIALLKARKRDSHIPNLSGYFVSALKGDWGSKTLISNESDLQVDKAAVFRHW